MCHGSLLTEHQSSTWPIVLAHQMTTVIWEEENPTKELSRSEKPVAMSVGIFWIVNLYEGPVQCRRHHSRSRWAWAKNDMNREHAGSSTAPWFLPQAHSFSHCLGLSQRWTMLPIRCNKRPPPLVAFDRGVYQSNRKQSRMHDERRKNWQKHANGSASQCKHLSVSVRRGSLLR